MSDNLKDKMIGTLAWTSVDRFGQQIIQFVVSIFLARLLSPNEFTLIALVMIFVTLSNTLVDGGFGYALVRKQDADEKDFSSVFYFNIFVSAFLYAILFFTAPLIADFYDQPDLTLISRVVFIAILINALYLIPNVKLVRALDFKKSATVNILAVLLSGSTGVILAFYNTGVWALVAQQLAFPLFRVVIISFYVNWKPKIIFSFNVIKGFFSFSISLLGTSILNNIFGYIYILVLGKFFPKQEVGYYYQANKLNEATNFSFQVILGSAYNVLVKIQDDTERFIRVFRELVKRSSVLIFPALLFLIAIADPLINVLLSSKWSASVPYFQLLCLASLFNPLYTLTISALNARGKTKTTFTIELVKKILIIISVLICIQYGIIALLIGFAVANWTAVIITIFAIKKEIRHFWRHQLNDILPSLFIGTTMAFLAFSLSYIIQLQWILLIVQLLSASIVYLALIRWFYPVIFSATADKLKEMINQWKRKQ